MSTPAGDGLVGDATIRVDGDTDPATRALARFSRDAQGRMRDVRGRFVSESAAINRAVTNNTPTLTVNTGPATTALNQFTRDVNGRLRDVQGRFVTSGNTITRTLARSAQGGDRFSFSLGGLADAAGRAAGVIASVGARVGVLAAGLGAAVPVAAGLVATLANIAPAAGLAATGILAVGTAGAALKVGMVGVDEAFKNAFDPAKAEEFNKALAKLSPNAQSFVLAVRGMKPEFDRLRIDVQDRLFQGLGTTLQSTAKTALPQLSSALRSSAGTFNLMAVDVLRTATGLSGSGALGKALGGATRGFRSLSALPAVLVQGLVQVGAAAAPSFARLAAAGGGAIERLSERMATAFESGAMQRSIETAISLIGRLVDVAGNVGDIIGSVFKAAETSGGGFIGTLQTITGQIAQTFQSPAVQSALQSLFQTMSTLATTAAPLLGSALGAIAPVLTALGPPVQRLIENLGTALAPIIENLGPVLESAAGAVGALADAVGPLLPVIGSLVASLLPPLVPVIDAIAKAFTGLAPIVTQLGQVLTSVLSPIIAALPAVIDPLVATFTQLTAQILPVVSQLITQLAPTFTQLGVAVGQLFVALGPLLTILGQLISQGLAALLPVLTPIISLVGQLAGMFAGELAMKITTLVIPALNTLTALLQGDFGQAWEHAKTLVSGAVSTVIRTVTALPSQIFTALGTLAGNLRTRATEAGGALLTTMREKISSTVTTVSGLPGRAYSGLASLAGNLRDRASSAGSSLLKTLREKIGDAVEAVKGLPGRARDGLGNLGGYLASAGRDLISGMIGGVREMAGDLASAATDVVSGAVGAAKSALGISSPSKVFATIGRQTGQGFIKGLTGTRAKISSTAKTIVSSITKAFRGTGSRTDDRLVGLVERGNKRLQSLAKQRDSIAKRIADAQKFSSELASSARTSGGLASIVQQDFFAPSYVEKRLKQSLAQIKAFTTNVTKLQKKGLNKDLLRQILQMGPEAGSQFAASLVGADKATIKRFNSLNSQINKASSKLGSTGADLLYDSGKKAGQGFLTGLKAQQKNIEKLMLSIAKGMQKAIRKALGIKSPSQVMAELGRMTVLGLQGGIARAVPRIDAAMAGVSGAMTSGVPSLGMGGMPALGVGTMRTGTGTGGSVTVVNHIHLTNRGAIGSPHELRTWLTRALEDAGRMGKLPGKLNKAYAVG
ncbi:phage tail protein [Streptomyces caniscabiei]|uniref:phage tail protein n=1 Tax=Streptomyces caniscabiei TaxID=2746961 RepID=UPI001872C15B|nr:hypothetical protein [Streptomyces caniscabiei]MBE4789947.1 hypothetical protein [Streptomyces caniscabiei]